MGEREESDSQGELLRGFSRSHVWRVYELCGKDVSRTARLLDLTSDEVVEWVGLSGASEPERVAERRPER